MKAHITEHPAHHTLRAIAFFAVSATVLLMTMVAFAPSAHATANGGPGTTGSSMKESRSSSDKMYGTPGRAEQLEKRIKELDALKARLGEMMKNYKTGSSTRPVGQGNNGPHRPGKPGHATSTPDRPTCAPGTNASSSAQRPCKPERPEAMTTPKVKVLHPNKGKVYRYGKDSGVVIMWTARGVSKVDIDLVKGSTTTSVAKGVAANNLYRKSINGHPGSKDPSSELKNRQGVGRYLYKNAPEGEGYKVVITGTKVGGGTVKDESDETFSIGKAKTKNDWFSSSRENAKRAAHDADEHEHEDDDGDVLGASTSAEGEFEMILEDLSSTLTGLSEDLNS